MAEGARLESVYTATYRGFESLSLRHKQTPHQRGFFMQERKLRGGSWEMKAIPDFHTLYSIASQVRSRRIC